MKFKREGGASVLCLKHYDNEIRLWLRRQDKCIGGKIFQIHERIGMKPRKSGLKDLTVEMAKDAADYTECFLEGS